ncbi:MAG: SpoIIE family protein phosphatase [Acidobacteria bacterium]|nr:SpoIIE family protein phosphatase [Acidobacteriota bacterium]
MANEAARLRTKPRVAEALDVLVLHLLERSGPLHGYRIAALLERVVGPEDATFDLPTLYSAILQQKQRGLLSATFAECEGRRVKTYAITARGRRYLKSARIAWERSASLLGGLLEEQRRQRRELELAREVQTHFFSSLAPAASLGLDVAGRYRPARHVGGDYYDIIRLSDTAVALTLGDVAGKGLFAALLMATLRAFVRSQRSGAEQLGALMSRLNHLLRESCPRDRFATLFYAVYESTGADLVYVNAGHHPPLLLDPAAGAGLLRLDRGGPVLGLLPNCTYETGSAPFAAGSVLVAYTDGVTEACDANGSDWGEERLAAAIRRGCTASADALADWLLSDVTRFMADGHQEDDMTLLVARRVGAVDER